MSSDVDDDDDDGLDELHDDFFFFVRTNATNDVTSLLANPALILTTTNRDGNCAMHFAAANGHADLIRLIHAKCAACVNVRNAQGNSPLAWAVQQSQLGSLRTLIALRADVNSANVARQTPWDIAVAAGAHNDICRALLDAGGKTAESLEPVIDAVAGAPPAAISDASATTTTTTTTTLQEILSANDSVEVDDEADAGVDVVDTQDASS